MIQVKNLHKHFEGKPVLEDISLEIRDGETLAIMGRSGSGKSVLLKHLIGLMKPDAGRVLVDETDINQISYEELRHVRRRFGVLFQGGALFDSMAAFDNVAFPLRTFTDKSPREVREEARRCLKRVQLADIGEKRPAEISGGMQKRVALARAIALRPHYMLYDEPTSGLDPETSNTINDLIRQLSSELNVTSVVITHDIHSVLEIADRAALLSGNQLRWVGTIDELHRSEDEELLRFVQAGAFQIGAPSSQFS